MRRHWPAVALMVAAIGGMTMSGCSKRPATMTGWTAPVPSAPAPTATGGDALRSPTPLSDNSMTNSGTPGTSSTPGMQADAARGRTEDRGAARPPIKDFAPASDLVDVYFPFDRYDIHPTQAKVLDSNARWLRSNGDLVLIEGHTDERGTSEYNLALGERRAASAMNYLVSQGIAANRITIVSYGKERSQCDEHSESCWQKNRRAHFLVKRQ